MSEPKTIYCPRCGRKAFAYDGKATMIIGVNCKKCRKRVVYNPISDKTKLCKIPERNTSSGKCYC